MPWCISAEPERRPRVKAGLRISVSHRSSRCHEAGAHQVGPGPPSPPDFGAAGGAGPSQVCLRWRDGLPSALFELRRGCQFRARRPVRHGFSDGGSPGVGGRAVRNDRSMVPLGPDGAGPSRYSLPRRAKLSLDLARDPERSRRAAEASSRGREAVIADRPSPSLLASAATFHDAGPRTPWRQSSTGADAGHRPARPVAAEVTRLRPAIDLPPASLRRLLPAPCAQYTYALATLRLRMKAFRNHRAAHRSALHACRNRISSAVTA